MWPGWSLQRVNQCAKLLNETLEELAASCAVKPSQLKAYVAREKFPANVSLLFHMREQHWLKENGINQ